MTKSDTKNRPALAVATVALCVMYAWAAHRLIIQFPSAYVWGELMISYADGWVRRGLFGSILYVGEVFIGAKYLAISLVLACYALIGAWLIRQVDQKPSVGAWLLLLSPAVFLFPVAVESTFARKDVFIALALVLTLWTANAAPKYAMSVMLVAYALALLIVDSAVFYLPIAATGVLLLKRPTADFRGTALHFMLPALLAIGFAALTILQGVTSEEGANAIAASWRERYPTSFAGLHAASYLKFSTYEGFLIVRNYITWFLAKGYVLGLFVSLVPVAFLIRELEFPTLSKWVVAALAGSTACLFLPFIIAADWGRYIHLLALHLGFVALAVGKPFELKAWALTPLATLAIVLYATTWNLEHLTGGGISPFRPGILFGLVGIQ